jgi:hypothetical protein
VTRSSSRFPGTEGARAAALWGALLVLAFGGHLYSTDVLAQLEVAGSLVGQRPFLTAQSGWAVTGADHLSYVPHSPGWSVLLVPAAALQPLAGDVAAKALAAAECALFSVMLVAVWHRLATRVNGSPPGIFGMTALGLCSMSLVYGRMPYDVTAAALFGTLALLASLEGRGSLAGMAAGAALLVRLDSLVFLPSLLCGRRNTLRALPWILAAAAILAASNWYRFGSPFEDGHSQDPAMAFTPGLVGLAGLIASPGKGLLFYAPAAFAAAFLSRNWKLWLPFALSLLIHSQIMDWTGGTGWGPRFLFTALPALLVPLAAPGRRRKLLAVLAIWGALTTAAAVWSDPNALEQTLGADDFATASRQSVIWEPSDSPLFNCIERIGSGTPDLLFVSAASASARLGLAAGAMQAMAASGLFLLAFRKRAT